MTVRYLVDENLPEALVTNSLRCGVHAAWVGTVLHGADDGRILARLKDTGEVLVTRDIRFANFVAASMALDSTLAGVVLIREKRMTQVLESWARLLSNPVDGRALVILTRDRTRVRRHFEALPEPGVVDPSISREPLAESEAD